MAFKSPLELADELVREARRNTLNKRINYKGNYENYINGGSHSLGKADLYDTNEYALAMNNPKSGWANDEWTQELNDRYTNPQHNERAGNSPVGSGYKYIHRYTPSTRRGRRVSDIFFEEAKNNKFSNWEDNEKIQQVINKYEGRK